MKKIFVSGAALLAISAAAYFANYYYGRRYVFGQQVYAVLPFFVFVVLSAAVLLLRRPAISLPVCIAAGTAASVLTDEYFLVLPLSVLLCAHSALFSSGKNRGILFAVSAVLTPAAGVPWIIKTYKGFYYSLQPLAENLPVFAYYFKIACAIICVLFFICFFKSFAFGKTVRKSKKGGTKKEKNPVFSEDSFHTFYLLCSLCMLCGCFYLFVFGNREATSTFFFSCCSFVIALYYDGDPMIKAFVGKVLSD